RALRKARDLDHGRVAVFGLFIQRDHDRAADAAVVRLEPAALAALAQDARDARIATLHDLVDAPLDPARGLADHAHAHAIAVHRGSDAVGRDVHVFLTGGGHEP